MKSLIEVFNIVVKSNKFQIGETFPPSLTIQDSENFVMLIILTLI